MKVQLAHILQSLYRTTELDEVPVHRLQETLREHPYFTAAQFLLLQKLKAQRSEQYDDQVQKAAIYFHDPLWMHWQLNHDAEAALKIESPSAMVQEHIEINGTVHGQVEQVVLEDQRPASFVENIDQFQSRETDIHIGESHTSTTESDIQTGETDTQSAYSNSQPSEIDTEVDESGRNEWSSATQSIHENDVETTESIECDIEPTIESIEQSVEPTTESSVDRVETTGPAFESAEPSIENIEAPTFESTEPSAEHVEPSSEIIRDNSEQRPIEETNPVIEMAGHPTIQVETNSAPKGENDTVPFDPYYTIDYFASQGIKAPLEAEPTDKLGRQLKSFTEWLKTMKRLPQVPVEQQVEEPDEAAQQDIRRFADDSLKVKQVVTETMAEVLIKQGRKEEAIRIYEKLSLLDPPKSAYFAAKIENLKVN